MPKRQDIKSILIIGAGPIIIGQACEFDYSGAQACKALKEEGYRVILVNSNPATIMTDPGLVDATYIEPITWEVVERIIAKERPDVILPTMGGQTALNCALDLKNHGVLDKYGIELIGASPKAIEKELIHLERVSVLAAAKGFMKWDYEKVMPERMGQYKRIIKPVNPVEGLNGSFIIGAYECRERNIGVLFFYNIYREEYYGELRAGGIPVIVHDATTINEFSSHLEAYLEKDLEMLYENPVVED